jgi:hypothetical protein
LSVAGDSARVLKYAALRLLLSHVKPTIVPKGLPAENVFPERRLPIPSVLGLCESQLYHDVNTQWFAASVPFLVNATRERRGRRSRAMHAGARQWPSRQTAGWSCQGQTTRWSGSDHVW